MRAFISIEMPDDLKKKISDFQKELKKLDILQGNWTNEYHLTLKFLGEINESKLKEIEKILSEIAGKTKRFELELKGLGAFPAHDYIRVIWAGAGAGDKEAIALHNEIDNSLAELGFEKEERYANHLTLVRVKNVSNKKELQKLLDKNISFGRFEVSEVKLIKSTLTGEGPVYETIQSYIFS